MSKFRTKPSNGTPEVSSARSRLDGVLQTLVERKDDSQSSEEPSIKEEQDLLDSVPNTPTKRPGVGKPPRKRRRGARVEVPSVEIGQYHHTYVMKLYDRSVDLAQFEEDTPLYPICRAWMHNQPHGRMDPHDRSSSPELQTTDSEDEVLGTVTSADRSNVYQLPVPIPIKQERGVEIQDLRIPSPVPMEEDEPLDIDNIGESSVAPEELLINHLNHWKQVRQSWKDSSRRNESRYVESWQALRYMFDQQCKDM